MSHFKPEIILRFCAEFENMRALKPSVRNASFFLLLKFLFGNLAPFVPTTIGARGPKILQRSFAVDATM